MKIDVRLDGIAPAQRLATWRDQICDTIVDVDFKTTVDDFSASLSGHATGSGLALCIAGGRAQRLNKPTVRIGRMTEDSVFFLFARANRSTFAQAGREGTMAPGQFQVIDTSQRFDGALEDNFSLAFLKVPKAAMAERLTGYEDLSATVFGTDSPLSRLAMGHMASLLQIEDEIDDDTRERLLLQALDLLVMPLAERMRREVSPSTHRSALLARVKRFIDANLRDRDLSPARASRALGLSLRYMNMLLATEGTSFGRYVLARRLEGCRRDLVDPGKAHLQVAEIAYFWGFNDPAHFSRAFRRRFEATPREVAYAATLRRTDQGARIKVR